MLYETHLKNFIKPEILKTLLFGDQKEIGISNEKKSLNEKKLVDWYYKKKDVIPGRWMFKIKHESNGKIDKFKARCVAIFLKQFEGIEYSRNFAPTSTLETFKTVIGWSAIEQIFFEAKSI